MGYKLTRHGKKMCKYQIREMKAIRKEILDAGKDTAKSTTLPTVQAILNDLAMFGLDQDGEYFNGWGVTDNYDYTICLKLGEDIQLGA